MKIFLLSLFSVGVISAVGCSDDGRGALPSVRIVPTLSRVTGLYFDKGDRIGLTITRPSGNYVANHPMDYDGTVFLASELTWYDASEGTATLTAYYPYSESGTPTRFTVALDQRDGCGPSDLLGAVQQDVVPGSAPVGMTFHHLMSQLSIVVENHAESPVAGVTLSGAVAEADVDLSVPKAEANPDATGVEIETFEVDAGLRYRAVLVPQQTSLTVEVILEDGTTCSKSIPEALFGGGKSYDLSIVVSAGEPSVIEVSLSGEIADWEEGGSLEDSENSDDGGEEPTQGVDYEGEHYGTATIGGAEWMTENLRYKPVGAQIGTGFWYPYDNDAAAVPTKGYLYDWSVAANGGTAATTPVRGICPQGWHIPDETELQALLESPERPADFFCCAGYRIKNGPTDRYGTDNKGMLMGVSDGEMCHAILFSDSAEPTLGSYPATYGMSLRCVKD